MEKRFFPLRSMIVKLLSDGSVQTLRNFISIPTESVSGGSRLEDISHRYLEHRVMYLALKVTVAPKGFHRVFNHLGVVMDHADDDIQPGFDGRLYGTG